ncbi:MAG TPA: hypothetical protein VKP30_08055 [Polyangiaceae bacterium]|nr:hypothetical protein [Polyangiaceae bacterium]
MMKLRTSAFVACLIGMVLAVACDDDTKEPSGEGKGGTSSTGGTPGAVTGGANALPSGGSGVATSDGSTGLGSGGTTGTVVMSGAGNTSAPPLGFAGSSGLDTSAGGASTGGTNSTAPGCNIYDATRPVQNVPTDANGNLTPPTGATELTLTNDKTWKLNGKVWVPAGVTLNIQPCTLVVASPKPNAGSLLIMRGAKIKADGTASHPIVFSSESFKFNSATPWGGVVLFGKAPIGAGDASATTPERLFEGLTDPRATYGGADVADSSGSLSYVRIEYGGDVIASTKEINGLTFGGVGTGTSVHHIMVKRTMDDCFEWFGGTVNAHHLICENPGDDMFDTDEKYRGSLQFLFGRLNKWGTSSDPSGFEWDGNQVYEAASERSIPHAANATLCGFNAEGSATTYGAVLRRGLQAGTSIQNTIITGFDTGVDTRDAVGTTEAPLISWTSSLFFGQRLNVTGNPNDDNTKDGGFDEVAWVAAAANGNGTTAPAGFDCYATPPAPFPTVAVPGADVTTIAGATFATAPYVGAFKDATDNWATGAWVDWAAGD